MAPYVDGSERTRLLKAIGVIVKKHEPVNPYSDLLPRPLGRFVLVGKTKAVPVVEILPRADLADSGLAGLCEQFAEALEAFGWLEWANAARVFEALIENYPNDNPLFFLARCLQYETQPPMDEDLSTIRLDRK